MNDRHETAPAAAGRTADGRDTTGLLPAPRGWQTAAITTAVAALGGGGPPSTP